MSVIDKNVWWMPYPWSEKFRKQLTSSTIRGLSFIVKVRDCNHKRFPGGDPSTPVPNSVPIYRPTRYPSVYEALSHTKIPVQYLSLKPSKGPTTDIIQAPSKYPLQQHKHKHRISFPKCSVFYVYIPSTTTQI